MKILITLDFPPEVGGIQRYLYDIVNKLYGEDDLVISGGIKKGTVDTDSKLSAGIKRVFFPLCRINKKINILSLLPVFLIVKMRAKEILRVECGNLYAALVPWLLFPFLRQPYSVYTYGTELVSLKHRSLKNSVLLSVLKNADIIYVLGRYTDGLIRSLGLKADTCVIPPKIELPLPCTKREKTADIQILNVARLERHKGQSYLIDSLNMLWEDTSFKCVIVGSGPEYQTLKNQIKEQSLEEKCEIKQDLSSSELHNEFCGSDIFVFPSISSSTGVEGFGIALLEAMAYRIPIIASSSGGITDVLDNGRCGLLVPERDARSIADSILSIYNNKQFTQEIVDKAYKHLVENYVWK